ncbi:MAG: flagellar FliJ family protein [Arsenophonus endosymbiont of Dermacentor nuttalli]
MLHQGTSSAILQNYQQFLLSLEHAIAQHQQHLFEWQQRETRAQKTWQGKQKKTNFFSKIKNVVNVCRKNRPNAWNKNKWMK